MQSEFRPALAYLCRRILYPLVRILVRSGVSAGELKSIIDSAYARAGAEYLEHQGERVSYSRLAVITGINRSVLPAIMAAPEGDFQPRSSTQLHRAARVLTGWHDDRDFQSRAGSPAVLPISGEHRTFEQLTRRYSGGVYYWTILAELERVGAVNRVGNDRVRANRRSLSAGGASAESLISAGEVAGDLMSTLDRNLTAQTHEQLPVQSIVLRADPRILPLFRNHVDRLASALIEQIETFLLSHRPERGKAQAQNQQQGLTLGTSVFAVLRQGDADGKEQVPSEESATPRRRRKR